MNLETLRIIKFFGAVIAVAAAVYSLTARTASEERRRFILIAWMIGPPLFFYAEYYFQAPLLTGEALNRFKDLQRLAASIWAGVSAALAVAYFKKG